MLTGFPPGVILLKSRVCFDMGQRTGQDVKANQSFLVRVCNALDEPPRMLAKNIGVEYDELKPLLTGSRGQLVDFDKTDVLWKVYDYVSMRMGMMLAIREELDRKLQADRSNMAARMERFKKHHDIK